MEWITERICEIEDRNFEIIQLNENKQIWMEKSEESLYDLWDTIKRTNLEIIKGPEEERENGAQRLFKVIMAENFLNLVRDLDSQVHEALIHQTKST